MTLSVFAHAALLLIAALVPLAAVNRPVYESAVVVYLSKDWAEGRAEEKAGKGPELGGPLITIKTKTTKAGAPKIRIKKTAPQNIDKTKQLEINKIKPALAPPAAVPPSSVLAPVPVPIPVNEEPLSKTDEPNGFEEAPKVKEINAPKGATNPLPVYSGATGQKSTSALPSAPPLGGNVTGAQTGGGPSVAVGSGGGGGGPGNALDSGPLRPGSVNYEKIRAAIGNKLSYPLAARKRGAQGTVLAGFSVDEQGKPREIRVIRSSGHRVLDRAALRTIKRAGPYPGFTQSITVPITFRLKD